MNKMTRSQSTKQLITWEANKTHSMQSNCGVTTIAYIACIAGYCIVKYFDGESFDTFDAFHLDSQNSTHHNSKSITAFTGAWKRQWSSIIKIFFVKYLNIRYLLQFPPSKFCAIQYRLLCLEHTCIVWNPYHIVYHTYPYRSPGIYFL